MEIIFSYDLKKVRKQREFKGTSLIDFPSDYCLIDIETTGLDADYDEIIEVAAIKVTNGIIVDEFQSLVKPIQRIDSFITDLTGITNEMVKDAPRIKSVIEQFKSFVGDNILIGHNVNFDINFLYDNSMDYGAPLTNDFVDTLRLARRILPELKHHRLKDLITHFKLDSTVNHRASDDAKLTGAVLEQLHKIVLEKYVAVEEFRQAIKKKSNGLRAADITATKNEFDESHPCFAKVFTFTGTLEKMVRKDAMQVVVDLGGSCTDNVTKKTNYLVLGNQDYSKVIDGKSSKHKKAEQLRLSGQDIEIISENVFYDLLEG